MIVLEFLVFVISSGLFCSERFRHHIWAVIVAGALATGSSLLFVYDLGAKLTGQEKQPSVITKIVRQTVVKTERPSQPASAGKPHSCTDEYPAESRARHEEGVTSLGFKILTDGTVDAIKVLTSSGSEALDDAAIKCVANWHYRPAIKDGQLVEAPWTVQVKWAPPAQQNKLAGGTTPKPVDTAAKPEAPKDTSTKDAPAESHPWYDVIHWFSGSSDNQDAKPDSNKADGKSP